MQNNECNWLGVGNYSIIGTLKSIMCLSLLILLLHLKVSVRPLQYQSVRESSPESRFYTNPCTPSFAARPPILHALVVLHELACIMYYCSNDHFLFLLSFSTYHFHVPFPFPLIIPLFAVAWVLLDLWQSRVDSSVQVKYEFSTEIDTSGLCLCDSQSPAP